MIEADLEDYLVRQVAKRGGKALKLELQSLRGFPDRTILVEGGLIVFVELKLPEGKISPQQKQMIGLLSKLGFRVEVLRTIEAIDGLIEEIFRKGKDFSNTQPMEIPRRLGRRRSEI